MVHAGCVFVASICPSRTRTSGSLESVWWNVCVHRLDLHLYSHQKEFWGNGNGTHTISKGKVLSSGGSEEGWTCDCITQDSQPNTLPTEPVTLHHAGQPAQHTTHWTCDAASHRTASPTHYPLSCFHPPPTLPVTINLYVVDPNTLLLSHSFPATINSSVVDPNTLLLSHSFPVTINSSVVDPNTLLLSHSFPATINSSVVDPNTLLLSHSFPVTINSSVVDPNTLLLSHSFPVTINSSVVDPNTLLLSRSFPATINSSVVDPNTLLLSHSFPVTINLYVVDPNTLLLSHSFPVTINLYVVDPNTLLLSRSFPATDPIPFFFPIPATVNLYVVDPHIMQCFILEWADNKIQVHKQTNLCREEWFCWK